MFVSKMRFMFVLLAASVLTVGLGAGVAAADPVHVVVQTPFFSRAEFRQDDGYFRTGNGQYYHYDRDRDGWHHGRNHREGLRFDRRHGGRR